MIERTIIKRIAIMSSAIIAGFVLAIAFIALTFSPIEEDIDQMMLEETFLQEETMSPEETKTMSSPRRDMDYLAIIEYREQFSTQTVTPLSMKSSGGIENGEYPTCPFLDAIDTDRVVWYTGNMKYCGDKTSCSDYEWSNKDLEWMAKIIHCEICDQGSEARRAVGTVVMNRIESDEFPSTVLNVISQDGQFSPWGSGIIFDAEPCEYCKEAAYDVLVNGYRSFPKEVLYFQSIRDGYFDDLLTYAYYTEAGFDTWFCFDPNDIESKHKI